MAFYSNGKRILNLPEQVGKNAEDIAANKDDINTLKAETSDLRIVTRNINVDGDDTTITGGLNIKGKSTFESDIEAKGKLKVNKFSNIVDKDNNSIANNFFSLDKNEQTFEIGQGGEGKIIKTHSVSSDGNTNYYGRYVFQTDSITLSSSGDGGAYIYISPSAINHKFANDNGYQYVFPHHKGGVLALTSDIPTYYRHTIRLDTTSSQSAMVLHGTATVIAKSNTPINSIQDLTAKLGNTDVMFSGIAHNPGGTCLLAYIHIGTTLANCHVYSYNLTTYSLVDFEISKIDFTVADSVTSI